MRGRPPHIREDVILDAARDVFLAEGLATTTAKIADRAGVSEGILFYRYKTKEALLAAVIARETRIPADVLAIAETAGKVDLATNLERIMFTIIRSMTTAHPFLLLAESSMSPAALRAALDAGAEPLPVRDVKLISSYLRAEMQLGRIRRVRPEPAARAIFGACIDHVRSRSNTSVAADRAFVRSVVDLLLNGLNKPKLRK